MYESTNSLYSGKEKALTSQYLRSVNALGSRCPKRSRSVRQALKEVAGTRGGKATIFYLIPATTQVSNEVKHFSVIQTPA